MNYHIGEDEMDIIEALKPYYSATIVTEWRWWLRATKLLWFFVGFLTCSVLLFVLIKLGYATCS